ncbi:hypothetical protein HDE69_004559 [Pedobacter cryoconitis]|uniref:DUF6965 domain-containing protein n=1 Tax=Pedobacter cryoconitis TaxID=188932 RepID=A0A7W8YXR8_9SPHI|nr:hypothetical protein [Pedobacter cryoconitis]MBB5623473.1 hypothetical protein [Pedobacter cryoconitis]MBB5645302.1 hypothetical protein [Pedobacter cryoconitis]
MEPEEYEEIFSHLNLPKEAKLWPGVYINDVSKFIESHLLTLKGAGSQRQKELHAMRLDRLVELIKNNQQEDLKL